MKRHGGLWEFPGGKLLREETHAEAARRELAEELGVAVTAVGAVQFSRADPGSEFVIDFVDVSIAGEPRALEHEEIAWVPVDELWRYDMPPSDRAFAETLVASAGD
jgi:8-oxo-dGTP pyrophosphatase MutT (NUDIX family)